MRDEVLFSSDASISAIIAALQWEHLIASQTYSTSSFEDVEVEKALGKTVISRYEAIW